VTSLPHANPVWHFEELVQQARLPLGQLVDASGGLIPMGPVELQDGWAALRAHGKDEPGE
jgi:hypothetical protein